jgi:hypothetical protein
MLRGNAPPVLATLAGAVLFFTLDLAVPDEQVCLEP